MHRTFRARQTNLGPPCATSFRRTTGVVWLTITWSPGVDIHTVGAASHTTRRHAPPSGRPQVRSVRYFVAQVIQTMHSTQAHRLRAC